MIGIHVFESRENPASGQQLSGLSVASVDHPWSGDDVGIRAKARPISDSTYCRNIAPLMIAEGNCGGTSGL